MKKGIFSLLVIVVIVSFLATPVGLIYLRGNTADFESMYTQIFLAVLFLLPVLAAFIGVFSIAHHSKAFQYSPETVGTYRDEKDIDPILHYAVGCLVAFLQDFSSGSITVPNMYSPEMRRMFQVELDQLQIYFDRGFRFHFEFYHNETYTAHIVHDISDSEKVVEVDGIFNYYFERNGDQHPTPHGYDTSPPLVQVPALVRLRIAQSPESGHWQLIGISENIRGLELGLATY